MWRLAKINLIQSKQNINKMKIKTTVKALKSAVDAVKICAPIKPLMPVLGGIKIEVNDNLETLLTAFDLANGLQVFCETEEAESGAIVILEKDLSGLLGKVSGVISIEVSGTSIKFMTEHSQIELQGIDASEYPNLIFQLSENDDDIDSLAQLPAKSFQEAISKCSVSASTDETKQILQGINIKSDGTIATLASTDGHRLTVYKIPCDTVIDPITLPAKFLSKLPKILTESIDLIVDNGQALISSDSTFICRAFDGKYPDYSLLLPKEFSRQVAVNRIQLLELLAVAEIASNSNKVELKIKLNSLSIHSSRDAAKAISNMDCKIIKGISTNIGMNIKYLSQGLKLFDDETAILNMNGAFEPVTIVSLDEAMTHLMMPVKIGE